MVFCKEKRPEIMKKNPGIAFGEVRPHPSAHPAARPSLARTCFL